MKRLAAAAAVLLLAGCAHAPRPQVNVVPRTEKVVKHVEPCPCSPTANQVVKKRWYDGFRVRWFH